MENSELMEDMRIGGLAHNFSTSNSLHQTNSLLSLTFDEIESKSGKNFGGMSMDDFVANISNNNDNNNINMNMNSTPTLSSDQPSFSIPIIPLLSSKTVDQVWSEFIHKQQPHNKFINQSQSQSQSQSQQGLGEITLEDFLVKAGVVQESSSSSSSIKPLQCSSNQTNCNTIFPTNRSMVDMGLGFGISLSYHHHHQHNAPTNMSGNCFSTHQMLNQTLGEPSNNTTFTDWVEHTSKKRIIDGPPEVVVQRRQRRMIKNRESAARSRARKQAYTVELEVELNQLKEENVKLKQIVAESERKRKQEMMQRKQSEKRQKPTERLRTMRKIASMAW